MPTGSYARQGRLCRVLAALVALTIALEPIGQVACASDAPSPRDLFYEIVVTAPGTRSQGWIGTLYGDGKPLDATSASVQTTIGVFVNVPCDNAWDACGMVHSAMLTWMKTHNGNVIAGSVPWSYRLYVTARGTKSEGYQGEIMAGSAPLDSSASPITTPIGPMVWKEASYVWDRSGWYHISWLAARILPSR